MQKPKFKILSIDGGGIRGIIPCVILKYIENQIGPLCETFDLIAGTSTGGIITLGLTKPTYKQENAFYAEDMLELYKLHGAKIFGERPKSKSNKASKFIPSKIGSKLTQLTQQPYLSNGLENLLKEKFDNAKLTDSLTEILITTYDIEREKPFYFLSRLAKKKSTEDFSFVDIARSTSAAPTFFTPSIVQSEENDNFGFIDGGVVANNPSILAYIEAKELYKQGGTKAFDAEVQPADEDLPFFMLSIGTGKFKKTILAENAKEFLTKDWLQPLVEDIFMTGVAESTHYTMKHLLPNYKDDTPRYHRINIDLETNIALDDVSSKNIEALEQYANRYIEENRSALRKICNLLK